MMATSLDDQILDGFRRRLEESLAVPAQLVDELVSLVASDSATSSEALLNAIKANVGDQSV